MDSWVPCAVMCHISQAVYDRGCELYSLSPMDILNLSEVETVGLTNSMCNSKWVAVNDEYGWFDLGYTVATLSLELHRPNYHGNILIVVTWLRWWYRWILLLINRSHCRQELCSPEALLTLTGPKLMITNDMKSTDLNEWWTRWHCFSRFCVTSFWRREKTWAKARQKVSWVTEIFTLFIVYCETKKKWNARCLSMSKGLL